ncbi:MAG: methyltransferase domain-containing protein [Saprospiraceae bacterium]|jgi:ubiquinone/menaquinone biosynthesis C-methylase UbiE|nr:methyltransferase domain-containing protein [Saprospiraceae bacterium]MBP9209485.1 methyltransferase domain-containing protein [Saprospiraceae bacterium]
MDKSSEKYLHGFSSEEQARLHLQNDILGPHIYEFIRLDQVSRMLEIGCGTGAQMRYVMQNYPQVHITGIDLSAEQLSSARVHLEAETAFTNRYALRQGQGNELPFATASFDCALMVWVLEHVQNPEALIAETHRVISPGGWLYLTEVFNNSFQHYPQSPALEDFWSKMGEFQEFLGGNGNVGIRLGAMCAKLEHTTLETRAKTLYFDAAFPRQRTEIWNYWIDLTESASRQMIAAGKISSSYWQKVRRELAQLRDDPSSAFYYSFIQCRLQR